MATIAARPDAHGATTTFTPATPAAPGHPVASPASAGTDPVSDAERRAGSRWARGIVAVLVGTMAINVWVLRTAGRDGGVNAEPDYYRRAVTWDAQQARATASAALGWTSRVAFGGRTGTAGVFTVALADRAGAPVRDARVTVRARWNGDATSEVHGTATATAEGYTITLPLRRAGLHEVQVEAVRGADRYETTVKVDAPVGITAAR
jgi:nitrogen fixation protein FixH